MARSPRHVHVVQRLAPGGIETLALELLQACAHHAIISLEGRTAELAANWPRLASFEDRIIGLDKAAGFDASLPVRLSWQLRRLRSTAVALHHIGPLIYGAPAARLLGIPNIIHVEHDAWHYDATSHRRLTRVIECTCAPRHVAVSAAVADGLRTILPNAAIDVIRNGVDIERFHPADREAARHRLGLPMSGPLIGCIGRLVHVKGIDVLIAAAKLLPSSYQFAIVGDGPERTNLQRQADTLGLGHRIHFLGHRDDIPAVLPAFDLYCLPSRNEGLPRGLLEAQACGLPVVATNVGAAAEAVAPDAGTIVKPEDPAALARAILQMHLPKNARAPRDHVTRHFNWQHTLAAYQHAMEMKHVA